MQDQNPYRSNPTAAASNPAPVTTGMADGLEAPARTTVFAAPETAPMPSVASPQAVHAPGVIFGPSTSNLSSLSSSSPAASVPTSLSTSDVSPPADLPPLSPVVVAEPHIPRVHLGKAARLTLISSIIVVVIATGAYLLGNQSSQKSSSQTSDTVAGQLALPTSDTDSIHLNRATFIDNGADLTASGQILIQNDLDSTGALTVQNAAGADVLIVDTINHKVGINTAPNPTGATLQVNGDISATGNIQANGTLRATGGIAAGSLTSAGNLTAAGNLLAGNGTSSLANTGLTINNVLVCTAQGCVVRDATTDAQSLQGRDTAFFLNSSNQNAGTLADTRLSTNVALLDRAGQTFTSTNRFNSTSTTAFQIQNAGGTGNLFVADTQNTRLAIGGTPATSLLTIGTNTTTAAGGITFGTDTNLYRSAADTLRTDDKLSVGQTLTVTQSADIGGNVNITGIAGAFRQQNANAASDVFVMAKTSADSNNRMTLQVDGKLQLGDGTSPTLDTNLYRSAANTLKTDDNFLVQTAANSTTAFQIQNATSASLFSADTGGMNITLNGANNAETSTWASTTSLPASRLRLSGAATNGYVYAMGGSSTGGSAAGQTTVYYSKINTTGTLNSWTVSSNPLPVALTGQASVVANGFIYVVSGVTTAGVYSTTTYYAKLNVDGSTGSWNTASSTLPTNTGRWLGSALTNSGYLYFIGGQNNGGTVATVNYAKLNADGSIGSWTTSGNNLPAGRQEAGAAVGNGYAYIVAGSSGAGNQQTIYYAKLNADGSTGTWQTNANNTPATTVGNGSVVLNGYIYSIGGASSAAVYYAQLNADGSTGTWSTSLNALLAVKYAALTVAVNGYIYAIAGDNGSPTNTVYYASTSRIKVGGSLDLVGLGGQNLAEGGTGGSLTAGNTQIVGSLTVADQANFAGSVSIGGNLSIQNSNGNNVLSADTSNLQVGVTNLNAAGTITLQNGQGASIQLRTASATSTGLTMSGNEITDRTRSTSTSGDGQAAPDSSTGIWEDTTNLVTNGGFETNTTDWSAWSSATIARVSSEAKYGASSLKSTLTAQCICGAQYTASGLTNGAVYTLSAWVKGATVGKSFRIDSSGGGFGSLTAVGLTTGWQKVSKTWTMSGTSLTLQFVFDGTPTPVVGDAFYLDGVQIEQQATPTPYVETNGGTAIRNASRVQGPASNLDETQGWVAARVRMGFGATDAPHGAFTTRVFSWGCTTGDCINFEYDPSIDRWIMNRGSVAGGISNGARSPVQTFVNGQIVTVVARWTSAQEGVSVDGSAFTNVATATTPPTLADALFDLGRNSAAADRWFNGDILWFTSGTGNLSDTDATNIHRFGNSDPQLNSFAPSAATVIAWDGVNKQYTGANSTPVSQSGITLDDATLYRSAANVLTMSSSAIIQPATDSTTSFQILSSTGTQLFVVDTTSNLRISLGSASATPVILVLGNKNTAGDPTCTDGGIYYNSSQTSGKQIKGCIDSGWTALGAPKVTSLPTTPSDGDEVLYEVDATNGIYWRFRYRAASASSYKWEYLSGSPLRVEVATTESTSSVTYVDLTTVGPSVTVPRAGEYAINFGFLTANSGAASGQTGAVKLGAAATSDNDRADGGGTLGFSVSRLLPNKTLSASDVVKLQYRAFSGTGSWSFRWIEVTPVRVN